MLLPHTSKVKIIDFEIDSDFEFLVFLFSVEGILFQSANSSCHFDITLISNLLDYKWNLVATIGGYWYYRAFSLFSLWLMMKAISNILFSCFLLSIQHDFDGQTICWLGYPSSHSSSFSEYKKCWFEGYGLVDDDWTTRFS